MLLFLPNHLYHSCYNFVLSFYPPIYLSPIIRKAIKQRIFVGFVSDTEHCTKLTATTCFVPRNSVLPTLLLQGAAPCPLFVTPCPFEKAEMTPCPFSKYQSHMAFSSVLPLLLPTHSVDCAVHLLLSHSRALLVSSALFHPFTALMMLFFVS